MDYVELTLSAFSRSSFSSSPPFPPDSYSPRSFTSLPPELIQHIFESIPVHPYDDLVATLASLCRINHIFFEIARPILYHEIHLVPRVDRLIDSVADFKLVDTLLSSDSCANLVRSIHIPLHSYREGLKWASLTSLVRRCKRSEKLSTGWEESEGFQVGAVKLLEAISSESTSIKHLVVPNIPLRLHPLSTCFNILKELDTLVFLPKQVYRNFPLESSLRRVVLIGRLHSDALDIVFSSSTGTLTTLSCHVHYRYPALLDIFPNLTTLRLILGPFYVQSSKHGPDPPKEQSVKSIRAILLSTHSLPLRSLALLAKRASTQTTFRNSISSTAYHPP